MSNKKKHVGMALDISTGKSYKVYKPEPETITLTLTREQAEQLKADLYREYMCGSVLGIIKQIEEKLK